MDELHLVLGRQSAEGLHLDQDATLDEHVGRVLADLGAFVMDLEADFALDEQSSSA